MNNLKTLAQAISFAAKKHKTQKRKGADEEPYINHPLEVLNLLTNVGNIEDYEILIAAVLHDTIEDTQTTKEEITKLFGENVCEMVLELTDDKSLPKAERKQLQIEHAPHISKGAKQIKLCDKISNIRDITENPPHDWSNKRRIEYIEWGEKVVAGLRGANENLENYFDELVVRAKHNLV
ncbi:MAG: HD domain-containing protein [Acidobacteria bacterium]|nr:HD domain-containing protein [Acidobacteriota bacterium]MCA1639145.1 HD domain-containing protein [Acidobacteriota bacterium]